MKRINLVISPKAFLFSFMISVFFIVQGALSAQQRGPLEPSDTTSIAATLTSFLAACNELHELMDLESAIANPDAFIPVTERIRDCLDLSGLPDELRDRSGLESAVYLKEVIDRIELPDVSEIPDGTNLIANGAGAKWRIPGTRLSINQVQSGPQTGEFLFSVDTVRRATKFYSAAKSLPYRTDRANVTAGFFDRFSALTKRQPNLAADTSSPRGTLTLFLNTANDIYEILKSEEAIDRNDPEYLPITLQLISCLDLSQLPEYSRDYYAAEAAVCLKEVLDRVPLPPLEEIPGAEDVKGIAGKEPLSRWQIPNAQLTITRITEGPRKGEYLFSSGSVERVLDLYNKLKKQPYQTDREVSEGLYDWYLSAPANPTIDRWVNSLPPGFKNRIGTMAVWQWIGLAVTVLVSLLIMALTYRIGQARSQAVRHKSLLRYWGLILFLIVGIIVPLLFMHVVYEYLTLRGTSLYVANFFGNLVFLIALIVFILGVSTRVADSIIALPSIQEQGLDATLTRIVCRLLGIIVATIIFLEGGRFLGFPITTLLASAGIGGLAVALSAQGMIKGLFGTITILLDKPFRVGERIVVNGHDGLVEEIGLRSTKIRTFRDNHLVSIPNDQMADSEVENVGRRQHIRKNLDLHIPLDTPREKVESAVALIRTALENHEGMESDFPPRVFFDEFESESFRIRAIYWFHPPNYWDYAAFNEKVNLQIMEAFEKHQIQFSLPSRVSFWKQDNQQGPLDVRVMDDEADSKPS